MTTLSSIALRAFNLIDAKNDSFSGAIGKKLENITVSTKSERTLSTIFNVTLHYRSIKEANAELAIARESVLGMNAGSAKDTLLKVINACELQASEELAKYPAGTPVCPESRQIDMDMSLSQAFRCKQGDVTISPKTRKELVRLFHAEMKRPDFARREGGLKAELVKIQDSINRMRECPARNELAELARYFEGFLPKDAESMPLPRQPGPDARMPVSGIRDGDIIEQGARVIDPDTMSLEACFELKLTQDRVSTVTLGKLDAAFERMYGVWVYDLDEQKPFDFHIHHDRTRFHDLGAASAALAAIRSKVEAMPLIKVKPKKGADPLQPAEVRSPATKSLLYKVDLYESMVTATEQHLLDKMTVLIMGKRGVVATALPETVERDLQFARKVLGWSKEQLTQHIQSLQPQQSTTRRPAPTRPPEPASVERDKPMTEAIEHATSPAGSSSASAVNPSTIVRPGDASPGKRNVDGFHLEMGNGVPEFNFNNPGSSLV
jgi:hypothetical protein